MEEASVEKDQEDCVSWKSSEAVDNSSRGQEDRLSAVTGADKTNQDNCQTDLDVKVTSKRDFDVDSSAVTLSLEDKFIGMETTFNRSQTQLQGHPLCQFSGQTNSNSSQTSAFTRTGQNLVVIEENTDQNIVLVPSSEIHQFQQQDSRTVLSTPETLMVAKQTDSNKETSNAHSSTPDFQTLPSSLSSTHLQSLPSLQMQSSSIFSVPHSVHDQQSQFQHRSVLPPAGERLTITDVKSLSSVSGSSLSPGTVTPPLSTVMSTTSILDTAVAQSLLSTSVSPAPAIQLSPTSMCNSHQLALLKLPLVSGRESINMETALECRWLNCNQLYMKMEDLVNHVNVAHVKVERDVEYKCRWEGCPRNGRGFNARYKMLIHVRTHTNEKPHRCSQCGKSFSRLENLKIHNRSHTGERPYVCPFEGCTKAYSNSSDRFKHVRTHQVDKPYCCKMPGCNKRYTDPSSLRKHIKTRSHFFRGQPLLIKPAQEPANENTAKTESANEMMKPRDQSQSMLQLPQSVSPNQLSSPLNSVFAIAPNGLISPSQVISLHGNVVPISALTSNPLLSSTMITPLVNTHSTSTQTESVVMTTAEAPSSECPNKDSRSGSPMLTADGKVHIQEGPLDLSTSPVNVISTPVDIGQGDGVSLNGVLQPKWDLINSDEVVYR